MEKIQFLGVHCTATPEGRDVKRTDIERMHRGACKIVDAKGNPILNKQGQVEYKFFGKTYTLEQLKRQTLELSDGTKIAADKTIGGRGWKALGYTDMIMLDGSIVRITENNDDGYVDSWEITNGIAGINGISRHIVYVGGCDVNMKAKDTRTEAQKITLENYVLAFVERNPEVKVAGHYQFANKACPSFDVVKWCRQIGVPEKNIFVKK